MKHTVLIGALLGLVVSASAVAAAAQQHTFTVGANIDAQGHVTQVQLPQGVSPQISKLLSAAAQRWRFMPAQSNGHAAPAHTFLYMRLTAAKQADGQYAVATDYLGNGPKLVRTHPPKYPASARHRHESGFILIHATVKPDGSLDNVTASNRIQGWDMGHTLERAAVKAARTWTAVPETVAGKPVATRIQAGINFTPAAIRRANTQAYDRNNPREAERERARRYTAHFSEQQQALLKQFAAAHPDRTMMVGTSELPSQRLIALDSPVKQAPPAPVAAPLRAAATPASAGSH